MMKTASLIFSVLMATLSCTGLAQADAFKHGEAKPTARKSAGFITLPNKKGSAGIQLSYKIVGTPKAGEPINLVVITIGKAGQVTMSADSGLTLQDPGQVLNVQAGKPSQHTVVVTPQSDGRFYLNFFSQVGDQSSTSSMAIQVGNSTANQKASAGITQTMPDGKRVKTIQVQ